MREMRSERGGGGRDRERERERGGGERDVPSLLVNIQFLEGRLQIKFIFDVPKEFNYLHVLKGFIDIY